MKNKKEKSSVKSLLFDVVDNIKEGAASVGKKTKEVVSEVYESGADIAKETNKKIHAFTEKQQLEKEQHKIEKRQKELTFLFGELCLAQYLETGSLYKAFLSKKAIENCVQEYKANTKKINILAKEIQKIDNV